MRILMVDDQADVVEPLRAELAKTAQVEVVDFAGFHAGIERLAPHVIVLDLAQGNPAEMVNPGLKLFDEIWHKKFCPLVIYTAVPQLLDEDARRTHPFVKLAQKGSGSEEVVIERIREFGPHLSALEDAAKEIGLALNRALRDVAPRIFENIKEEGQQKEMLVRSARRRVAAAMDEELSTGGPNLRSWEHYLYPPTTTHLLTGDIIRKRGGDTKDTSNYAVVLTPSCDLAFGEKRDPNVKSALVAACKDVRRLLKELKLSDSAAANKYKDKIRAVLTAGHGRSCLPVPGLPEVFPPMVADFQDLNLVPLEEIGNGKQPFERIASADNPFRELVAWAYMMNAGRPGLPDRDFDGWVEEIIKAIPDIEKTNQAVSS
jgi:hypothetical protein